MEYFSYPVGLIQNVEDSFDKITESSPFSEWNACDI